MNKDVRFSKSAVGVALAFFLMSGASWSVERESFDEDAVYDCALGKAADTGFFAANPDATMADLEGSQIFAGCMATRASGDDLSRSEVDEIIEEDESWRAHLRDFDASQTRDSQTAYPLLRLERLSPADGR